MKIQILRENCTVPKMSSHLAWNTITHLLKKWKTVWTILAFRKFIVSFTGLKNSMFNKLSDLLIPFIYIVSFHKMALHALRNFHWMNGGCFEHKTRFLDKSSIDRLTSLLATSMLSWIKSNIVTRTKDEKMIVFLGAIGSDIFEII